MLTGHLYTLFLDVFVQEYYPYFYCIVFYLSVFLIVLSRFYSQLYFFSFYFHSHYNIQTHIFFKINYFKTNTVNGVTLELIAKGKAARTKEIALRLKCGLKYGNMFYNPCKQVCKVLSQCCDRLFHQSWALATITWGEKIPEAKSEARFSKRKPFWEENHVLWKTILIFIPIDAQWSK